MSYQKKKTQCSRLGLEPRLPDPEWSVLTIHEATALPNLVDTQSTSHFLVIPLVIRFGSVL